jgi:hypothetical protein
LELRSRRGLKYGSSSALLPTRPETHQIVQMVQIVQIIQTKYQGRAAAGIDYRGLLPGSGHAISTP